MLKPHSKFFEHATLLADLCIIAVCWLAAYGVRFHGSFRPHPVAPPLHQYLLLLVVILLVWPILFRAFGLHRSRRISSRVSEIWDITKAATALVLVLMAVSFLYREFSFSRFVFLGFWAGSIAALSLVRAASREVLRLARRRNLNLRYGLIVGTGDNAQRLIHVLQSRVEVGVRLVGALGEDPGLVGKDVGGTPVLGLYGQTGALLKERRLDIIFIALPLQSMHRLEEILADIGDSTVDIKVIPDLYRYITLRGSIEEFQGIPIISLRDAPLHGWSMVTKRVLDLVVSSLALVVSFPVMLAIAGGIKATSRGPVLFRQERMGYGGQTFTMLKFRTMRTDHQGDVVPLTPEDDARVTPFGRFLRRTSLDELPQLWNVFRGEMSIVGPRPERPWVVAEFRRRLPTYMLKHKIQAGMTGWAQVNGWRGNTSVEKRIEYDLYYIEHWSLWFDIKIMLLTIWKGFVHRHAY
jgi:Undecaprenyl-phosphate glucose phosphotransferase